MGGEKQKLYLVRQSGKEILKYGICQILYNVENIDNITWSQPTEAEIKCVSPFRSSYTFKDRGLFSLIISGSNEC